MNSLISNVTKHMDKYEFNVVGKELYSFVWDDFCDWYIELAKTDMNDTTKTVLLIVLTNILKLLHPFMPYVTEEIYLMLPIHDESIMISEYPKTNKKFEFKDNTLDLLIELIKKIRKIKLENNLGKDYLIVTNNKLILQNKNLLSKILKNDHILTEYNGEFSKIDINFNNEIISLYYDGRLTLEEKEKLLKEKERLINSIARREKLLSNVGYINKAPQQIVENEKNSLINDQKELELIIDKLK